MIKLFSLLSLVILSAFAQNKDESLLNKLFAPGPLIEGHKDLEGSECLKCHEAGKGLNDGKCLDCHKELKVFVDGRKGFHGLTQKRCNECHRDHKGRNYDSVQVDIKNFDHKTTGYKLTGKHAKLECKECHTDKRTDKFVRPNDMRFFGKSTNCIACHKKDDIHYFRNEWAKKDCNSCHSSDSWTHGIQFDHNKDTEFKLKGTHAELKCNDCHKPSQAKPGIIIKPLGKKQFGHYNWPNLKSKQCLSCHQEYHGRNLSKRFQNGRCDTCHNQTKWELPKFDHSVTDYPLRGKHSTTKCIDCHKQNQKLSNSDKRNFKYTGLKQDCLSCHDDFHYFGKFSSKRLSKPNQCLGCHTENNWQKTHDFNHTVDTRFIIDGEHSSLKCNDCHKPLKNKKNITITAIPSAKPGIYHWSNLSKDTCATCHSNPHTKTFSKKLLAKKCTDCHVTDGWKMNPTKTKKNFDHSVTRFALTGRHAKIDCSNCHNLNGKQIFKFPSFEEKFCIDCHRNPHVDQFHNKFSDRSCSECHSTVNFSKQKTIDHDQTAFALKGRHLDLKCAQCHTPEKRGSYEKKPVIWHKFIFPDLKENSCTTCHNDFHAGQLGQKCETCHNENKWKTVKFDHNLNSRFELRGKHKEVKCSECHKPIPKKSVQFGEKNKRFAIIRYRPISSDCINCHRKDDKHNGNFGDSCQNCHLEKSWSMVKDFHRNFNLHGVHFTAACAECHRDERQLGGMSENCILCHQKDDVHNGSLPNCNECHRQQFWEHATFRHSLTSFPIRGSHRTLDCFDCHNDGKYQGTPTSCRKCHDKDVVNTRFNHATDNSECNKCHNQFIFDLGL